MCDHLLTLLNVIFPRQLPLSYALVQAHPPPLHRGRFFVIQLEYDSYPPRYRALREQTQCGIIVRNRNVKRADTCVAALVHHGLYGAADHHLVESAERNCVPSAALTASVSSVYVKNHHETLGG